MCTLTFINNKNQIIITSNRDEDVLRADVSFPIKKEINNQQITFPRDPLAGGTWLAASKFPAVHVLLNGAFVKHKHSPPYRLSRGIVLLDSFEFESLSNFKEKYPLENIEPFTLVRINIKEEIIEEVRWDGKTPSYSTFDFNNPHIWSSATLYTPETIEQREEWFKEWITQKILNPEKMLKFHHFGGGENTYNSIKMARNSRLKTVSISQIHTSSFGLEFHNNNLISEKSISTII